MPKGILVHHPFVPVLRTTQLTSATTPVWVLKTHNPLDQLVPKVAENILNAFSGPGERQLLLDLATSNTAEKVLPPD